MYQTSQKGSLEGAVKELGRDVKGTAKSVVRGAVAEVKEATS